MSGVTTTKGALLKELGYSSLLYDEANAIGAKMIVVGVIAGLAAYFLVVLGTCTYLSSQDPKAYDPAGDLEAAMGTFKVCGSVTGVCLLALGILGIKLYRFNYREEDEARLLAPEQQAVGRAKEKQSALTGLTKNLDKDKEYNWGEVVTALNCEHTISNGRFNYDVASRKRSLISAAVFTVLAVIASVTVAATVSGEAKELALDAAWITSGVAIGISLCCALGFHLALRSRAKGQWYIDLEERHLQSIARYIDKVGGVTQTRQQDRLYHKDDL